MVASQCPPKSVIVAAMARGGVKDKEPEGGPEEDVVVKVETEESPEVAPRRRQVGHTVCDRTLPRSTATERSANMLATVFAPRYAKPPNS